MKRAVTIVIAVAVVLGMAAATEAQEGQSVNVYITNLSKQIISPPLVMSHTWKVAIFVPGLPATEELTVLAEDGDPAPLAEMLAEHEEVFDVDVAAGMLFPGETAVLNLQTRGKFNRISAVGMLVTTNDAFFGLSNYFIEPSEIVQRTEVPAWDAGTEVNSEMCATIPGPPCGNPFERDTEGAEGFVHVHSGIHGDGDLLASEWDWRNPVVLVTVIAN